MSQPVPTREPDSIRAGETLTFSRSLDSFPAPTWTLSYAYRCKDCPPVDFTAAADGSSHLVTVAATDTANWMPGTYYGVARVTDGSTVAQIWQGKLIILANLAAQTAEFDPRSQARRSLDNINAVLEGRASSTILNSEIEGTKLERIPFEDLLLLRDHFQAIVAAEEAKDDAAAGKPSKRNIYGYFWQP